ncbi:hypothetical protein BJY04DRAFT_222768 [Aspergillus karnatakaensis]|uniref:uncharacterized protein n=1 Tax=Aspergillus karnatakaensis TaxID=1810916 RepID=UPI003CCDE10F
MISFSASVIAAVATTVLSATVVKADQIGLCTDASCNSNCPLYTDTLDSPDCGRLLPEAFDNNGYELNPAGGYVVYLDIPQPESDCQYIIGSGAGCGAVVGRYKNGICARQPITVGLSFSKCCGDCGDYERVPAPAKINSKRDCDTFTASNGPYEIVGPSQYVGAGPHTGPGEITIDETVTTGWTTSFSASVGDPFGIISVETGISFEESISTSLTYTFTLLEGQVGYVAWSPLMECVDGTLSNCDDGASDETGQACTPKKDGNGEVVGQYNLVSTSKVPGKRAVSFSY